MNERLYEFYKFFQSLSELSSRERAKKIREYVQDKGDKLPKLSCAYCPRLQKDYDTYCCQQDPSMVALKLFLYACQRMLDS